MYGVYSLSSWAISSIGTWRAQNVMNSVVETDSREQMMGRFITRPPHGGVEGHYNLQILRVRRPSLRDIRSPGQLWLQYGRELSHAGVFGRPFPLGGLPSPPPW